MVSTTHAETPRSFGYAQPAEWAPHRACWTAWPAHTYAWGDGLLAAQREFVPFVRAFAQDAGQERLNILVDDAEHAARVTALMPELLAGPTPRIALVQLPCGDVWLRDTAPIFVRGQRGIASVRFNFNGWGDKFLYPDDAELSERIASLHGSPAFSSSMTLEGGALEVDGLGTCLTTRPCLLNPNRGASSDPTLVEAELREMLGISKLIWLDQGLLNDHTDGHIDNIARFVEPGVVVCMQAQSDDDPNARTLDDIAETLSYAQDASGQRLRVVRIPSPGKVLGVDGSVVPASYMNFYIGNRTVIMPSFGTPWDEPARVLLAGLFRDRQVVACSARAILEGGGTFHCMTQQEPLP